MKNIIWCILAILLVSYLVAIFVWIAIAISGPKCTGMEIRLTGQAHESFVSRQEVAREIDNLPDKCVGMPLSEINTDSIERILNSIDKIEKASCVVLNSGRIIISVTPMQPVARVFDGEDSYYINRVGKRISADARYFLDVPVLAGDFDSAYQAVSLLPLVEYIQNDSVWSSMISMIKTDSQRNIILVPVIRGHVINFGQADNMENKFMRLHRFYTEVMPVKGWDYYDTIAVKWDGQIVATKRSKKLDNKNVIYDDEVENEIPEVSAMQVDALNESTDSMSQPEKSKR